VSVCNLVLIVLMASKGQIVWDWSKIRKYNLLLDTVSGKDVRI